jgi:hypothetical protein
MTMHSLSETPGGRILFVCDSGSEGASSPLQECTRLCDTLASMGLVPLVLRGWPSAPHDSRHAAKVQEHPYSVYCSREVYAEAPLLALLEQPSVAITLGKDPVGLAQPLLESGVSCIAWFQNDEALRAFPAGPVDRRLGLAAASSALAGRLQVLTGRSVATLLPPLPSITRFAGGGDAVLMPADRLIDGLQRVLEIAHARPDYRFHVLSDAPGGAAVPARLSHAPANVTRVDKSSAPCNYRVAVLPALGCDLPWHTLAQCLAAGIPVLGSTEPLLVETLRAPDLLVSATAPLEAWLAPLDRLMRDDVAHAQMGHLAVQRSNSLCLSPQTCAEQCLQVASQHLASTGHLLTGHL